MRIVSSFNTQKHLRRDRLFLLLAAMIFRFEEIPSGQKLEMFRGTWESYILAHRDFMDQSSVGFWKHFQPGSNGAGVVQDVGAAGILFPKKAKGAAVAIVGSGVELTRSAGDMEELVVKHTHPLVGFIHYSTPGSSGERRDINLVV